MTDDILNAYAAWAGILDDWYALDGTRHVTTPDTKRALLSAMGLDTSEAAIRRHLDDIHNEASERLVASEYVVTANTETSLPVSRDTPVPWTLTTEDGVTDEGTATGELRLPPLPAGYHELTVAGWPTFLVAAPQSAPSPADVAGKDRMWGVTGALYALRSSRNLGLGDYRDLADLVAALGPAGADFFGINPVHALGHAADVISPYSPSHRQFLDTRHIALEDPRVLGVSHSAHIDTLRHADIIDYAAVARVRDPALRAQFGLFCSLPPDHPDVRSFEDFRNDRGEALERFCLFEAVSEGHGPDWRSWPDAFGSPTAPGSAAFRHEHQSSMRFHAYLQWMADGQLAAAHDAAISAGMALGLYADLAVGVRPNGAEPWAEPDTFAHGVSLGAPPDYFNPDGQTWGLLPFNPQALRINRYGPFIDTIRAVARHAGMIRIDHVVGLQRCFVVPDSGDTGGYIANSLDTLLAIVKIEAWRAQCIVIGEDLGIVPEGFRERSRDHGLLGYCVMQFEREADGGYRPPETFAPATLASFGTHDTPTMAGFWSGTDIEERHRIGQIDKSERDRQYNARATERHALGAVAILGDDADQPKLARDSRLAVHAALSRRGSALCAVQLDDIVGETRQPNMPGTIDEYPNWRVRSTVPVEDWATQSELHEVSNVFGVDHSS